MTSINRADGATPSLLLRMPRFAEIRANGIMSFKISSAPCEKGSKIGISRWTLSRLKDDTEATFPVLKNADCSRVRKIKETRASDNVSDRKGDDSNDAGITAFPFICVGIVLDFEKR